MDFIAGKTEQLVKLSKPKLQIRKPGRQPLKFSKIVIDSLPKRGSQRLYAKHLGVSLGLIQQWMTYGEKTLGFKRVGTRGIRVTTKEDLLAWLKANDRIE